MIYLKEVRQEGTKVYCDAYPEDEKVAIPIVIDIEKREVDDYTVPEGKESYRWHMSMARNKVLKLIKNGEPLPKEIVSMWY